MIFFLNLLPLMGIGESISGLNDKHCAEIVKSRPIEFKDMDLSQNAKQKSVNVMPSKY